MRGGNERIHIDEVAAARRGRRIKRRRDDAHDRQRQSVQRHGRPERRRIAVVPLAPELMRDNRDHFHGSRLALALRKQAPTLGAEADDVEKCARHERSGNTLRLAVAGQIDALREPQRDLVECPVLTAKFLKLGE